ncbi:Transcriptional regulatory protein CusR [Cedecea neteri]|uniref:Transcriptional regulatory protein CusR n=1 Tax=Cedecea neteri TaxID=158822 RepID=A0A2X3L5B1_9ENTR|nr:Transcriptional regulatory protein CusR [Cedecea neteri]
MKILIIEDEAKTASYLVSGLNEAGYTADWAANGIDGLHLAREESYDLILLDVMLPEMNGWTVMERFTCPQPDAGAVS